MQVDFNFYERLAMVSPLSTGDAAVVAQARSQGVACIPDLLTTEELAGEEHKPSHCPQLDFLGIIVDLLTETDCCLVLITAARAEFDMLHLDERVDVRTRSVSPQHRKQLDFQGCFGEIACDYTGGEGRTNRQRGENLLGIPITTRFPGVPLTTMARTKSRAGAVFSVVVIVLVLIPGWRGSSCTHVSQVHNLYIYHHFSIENGRFSIENHYLRTECPPPTPPIT